MFLYEQLDTIRKLGENASIPSYIPQNLNKILNFVLIRLRHLKILLPILKVNCVKNQRRFFSIWRLEAVKRS